MALAAKSTCQWLRPPKSASFSFFFSPCVVFRLPADTATDSPPRLPNHQRVLFVCPRTLPRTRRPGSRTISAMQCSGAAYAVPLLAPAALAFAAATVRGISGFGDGITFQALWQLCAALGILPGAHSPSACWALRKAVLYSTIMQTITMPMQAWQARAYLRRIAGYTLPMVLAGSGLVALGAHLLLHSENALLRPLIGALFLLFSVAQLALKARARLRALHDAPHPPVGAAEEEEEGAELVPKGAAAAAAGPALDAPLPAAAEAAAACTPASAAGGAAAAPAALPPSPSSPPAAHAPWVPPLPLPEEISLMLQAAAAPSSSTAGTPSTLLPTPTSLLALPPALAPYLPPLSPTLSPLAMLLLLLPAACAGGLLGGLMGAGGPPLMAAYSILNLDKELLRGFGIVPSMFMLIRLSLYTGGDAAVFNAAEEGGVYVAILVCSLAGVGLGSWLRKWVDGERVVLILLVLVYLAAGLMLDLFVDARANAALGVLTAGGCGVFAWAVQSRACAQRMACLSRR